MDEYLQAAIDFIKVRQLNLVIAAFLTIGYMAWQYLSEFFQKQPVIVEKLEDSTRSECRSRSRSRSRSRYYPTTKLEKHIRGRRAYGRCPDCSKCNNVDNS